MAQAPVVEQFSKGAAVPSRFDSSTSLWRLAGTVRRRWRIAAGVLGVLLAGCLVYCLVAPRAYEAQAKLALRLGPASALHLDGAGGPYSGSLASGQEQLETQANVLRSDELAWRTIVEQKLYDRAAFSGDFMRRFPDFRAAGASPAAQAWLLERFQDRLRVRTIPRTLIVEVSFRSADGALSAAVVSSLLRAYSAGETQERVAATQSSIAWLQSQLDELRKKRARAEERVLDYQMRHGLVVSPQPVAGSSPNEAQHVPALTAVDDLGHELVAATSDRILREAEYRAALDGDPEAVLATDAHAQGNAGDGAAAGIRLLRSRRSDLEQEQARLSLEDGPNFPRVREIRKQLEDLDRQLAAQDAKLREMFKAAWKTAEARETLVRRQLADQVGAGQGAERALAGYEALREEAEADRDLYVRMEEKTAEARMTASMGSSALEVIDPPRVPAKPVSPNVLLDFAITIFGGAWLSILAVVATESFKARMAALVCIGLLTAGIGRGQAPTPSTSGLPTGVAKIPGRSDAKAPANPNEAPRVWTGPADAHTVGTAPDGTEGALPGPIAPGDVLAVSEFHTPEFRSEVRVSAAGTVALPMIGEVDVRGMDEAAAAKEIEQTLVAKGVLLHPQVSVLVTVAVGQDVTVLGEVARPGVYPYQAHHRLWDAISLASGLTASAGSVIAVLHRDAADAPVVIDVGTGTEALKPEHNPELLPGDTVRVSRAGLVYVVGDVLRPGGFAMEPGERMTVLRALSLAWGPSMNAALKHAVILRERGGGRAVIELNLKRMLEGRDPDLPVEAHDIVYVPDSAAKNLWNRTMESVVQSTAGVSIYAAMVFSQRF